LGAAQPVQQRVGDSFEAVSHGTAGRARGQMQDQGIGLLLVQAPQKKGLDLLGGRTGLDHDIASGKKTAFPEQETLCAWLHAATPPIVSMRLA
jgi:hypothetical protein